MGDTFTVKAAPGLKCPREDNSRRYIEDDKAVTVPASSYYVRRLRDGDLVEVKDAPAKEGK